MRNLLAGSKAIDAPPERRSAHRPDALRLATLVANARIVLGAALVLLPAALFAAVHGQALGLLIDALGLAIGGGGLLAGLQGARVRAAALQIYGLLFAGIVLAVADPNVADFGLALALLAPIEAALLGERREQRGAWLLVAVVLVVGIATAAEHVQLPEFLRHDARSVGGLAFLAGALVVAYSTNRLNTAFEVYDRGQINVFRHLIEHMQDGVLRFAADGELLFCSASTERLLACRRYELSGQGLLERIHVLDRPAYLTAFSEVIRGKATRKLELRMRFDGNSAGAPSFIWVEVSLSPVCDSEAPGGQHEVVALLRDITARRDQDNEMRAARRAAEQASEAKSRFLATIGHELRTPLNAIVGFSDMMTAGIGGELSPTHREYAGLIHASGTHLIGVVGMLLDMSRIEAGKFELHADVFAPESLIDPCFAMVRTLAVAKGVTFETDVGSAPAVLHADERACRQILINLLSNAIKFSHEQGVVSVRMKAQGNWLNLSVTDCGIGMSPQAVARVGEPFFQVHEGLSRRYEGTGLGLSIVKGLVDLHQGALRISSETGQGTTMTVLLPINGPEIKLPETAAVTPLRRDEPPPQTVAEWPEPRRSAK